MAENSAALAAAYGISKAAKSLSNDKDARNSARNDARMAGGI